MKISELKVNDNIKIRHKGVHHDLTIVCVFRGEPKSFIARDNFSAQAYWIDESNCHRFGLERG